MTARIPPVLTGQASAFPQAVAQESIWSAFFSEYFGGSRLAHAAFMSAGITTRHAVANPIVEDLSLTATSVRMERYVNEAMPLCKEAIGRSLDRAIVDPDSLGLFAVVTCTGYSTPGIDILLARDVGMSASVERVLIGHVGCHAVMPALQIGANYVAAKGRPALILSVELPSLHIQPRGLGADQIVPHALFSDAASAVVIEPGSVGRSGLGIVDFATSSSTANADCLTWRITETGFRMHVSRRVPEVIGEQVGSLVADLLARNDLRISDVSHWAVHPGGPRVLDTIARALGIDRAMLSVSDAVLNEHGNCSSATVLVAIEEMRRGAISDGAPVVALAFGPGLSCSAALLAARC